MNFIPGVTVTFTDTIGSRFFVQSAQTDSGGFYTVNFTLGSPKTVSTDFITIAAAAGGYTGSSSTIFMTVNPYNSMLLSVAVDGFLPSTLSTYQNHPFTSSAVNDYLIAEAEITAGGTPVQGAYVTFSDSFGSTFTPTVARTDVSGVAITELFLSSGNTGIDTISASASLPSYSGGIGSNAIYVLPRTSTQLSVSVSTSIGSPTSGSSDFLNGRVQVYGVAYIPGVTLTFSDTIGSQFFPQSIQSDKNGSYSVTFTLGTVSGPTFDLITVAASGSGYTGSSSAILVLVNPSGSISVSTQGSQTIVVSTTTVTNTETVTSVSVLTMPGGATATVTSTAVQVITISGTTTITRLVNSTASQSTTPLNSSQGGSSSTPNSDEDYLAVFLVIIVALSATVAVLFRGRGSRITPTEPW